MKKLQDFIIERGAAPIHNIDKENLPSKVEGDAIVLIEQIINFLKDKVKENDKEDFESFLTSIFSSYNSQSIIKICKILKIEEKGNPQILVDYVLNKIYNKE